MIYFLRFLLLLLFPYCLNAHDLATVPGRLCDRPCSGPSLHCIFDWAVVERNLSVAGFERAVTTVQDKQVWGEEIGVPGPPILVCKGDLVTIEVENERGEGTSIHWHGQYQHGSQWADGVPGVTQCPIAPGSLFPFYQFTANPAGTFWYHSHTEFQRDDGLSGVFVVRDSDDVACDLTEHVVHLQEWYKTPARERYESGGYVESPAALLVNGQGRVDLENTSQPWPVFKISPACAEQRFRVVGALTSHCPVVISVEGHQLVVVASDGQQVEPEVVTSLTIANGERFDFLISTEGKEAKSYQMTFAGSEGSWPECSGLASLAFLQYEDAPVDQAAVPDYAGGVSVPGRHLNPCPSLPLPDQQTEVAVKDLRAKEGLEHTGPADSTFYFLLGDGDNGASINMVQMPLEEMAKNPPLLAEQPDLDADSFCQGSYTEEGTICDPSEDPSGCACFHVLHAPFNQVIELFLVNPNSSHPVAHPVHLHGHHYSVLSTGPVPASDPLAWVQEQNLLGTIPRNLDHPPRKDSMQTKPGHYTLIRFYTDNPGYWLIHCHISFDLIEGQVLVVSVGEEDQWNLPPAFPTTCNSHQ